MSDICVNRSFNNLLTVNKLKKNNSRMKANCLVSIARKLPLIRQELTNKSYQQTESLIQSIIDCNLVNLRDLLATGIDVNTKYNDWSLLHYACSMIEKKHYDSDQQLEMIRILLENGANINSQDEDRWTPLHLACQSGVTRVIS
jgi:ankyrin repeat protein